MPQQEDPAANYVRRMKTFRRGILVGLLIFGAMWASFVAVMVANSDGEDVIREPIGSYVPHLILSIQFFGVATFASLLLWHKRVNVCPSCLIVMPFAPNRPFAKKRAVCKGCGFRNPLLKEDETQSGGGRVTSVVQDVEADRRCRRRLRFLYFGSVIGGLVVLSMLGILDLIFKPTGQVYFAWIALWFVPLGFVVHGLNHYIMRRRQYQTCPSCGIAKPFAGRCKDGPRFACRGCGWVNKRRPSFFDRLDE